MAKFSREDKLRISGSLLQSEAWALIKEELDAHLAATKSRIDSATETGDVNRLFATESYRMALEYVLKLPQKMKDENTNYFDRLYKKVVGAE